MTSQFATLSHGALPDSVLGGGARIMGCRVHCWLSGTLSMQQHPPMQQQQLHFSIVQKPRDKHVTVLYLGTLPHSLGGGEYNLNKLSAT